MQTAILVVAVSCQIPQIPVSVKRAIQSGIKRHADWRSEGCNIITGNWWRCHSWLLVKRLLKTKEIIYFRRTVRVHSAWKMCRSWLSLKVHEKAVLFWRRKVTQPSSTRPAQTIPDSMWKAEGTSAGKVSQDLLQIYSLFTCPTGMINKWPQLCMTTTRPARVILMVAPS